MEQESKLFGTGVRRISTGFRDFLDSPQNNKGPYHYLITQYSDDDDDVSDTFPPPTNALNDDFPLVPTLMGPPKSELMGRKIEGRCFFGPGRKRFVVYPPSQSHHLHPHGKIKKVHPNGLISYEHNPVWSDGLNSYDAAKYKVQALKKRLSELKSSSKSRAMDVKLVKKAYEEARNAFRELQGDSADADFARLNDADDADAILARSEAQEKKGKGGNEEEE